jgi:hypothetical protein
LSRISLLTEKVNLEKDYIMNQETDFDAGTWLENEASALMEKYGDDLDVSKLPNNARVVYLVWEMLGLIGNGGTDTYFFNTGHLIKETWEVLNCIKAHRTAALLLKLASFYSGGFPSNDIDESRLAYESLPKAFFDLCMDFDRFTMGESSNDYHLEENLPPLVYNHLNASH